MTSAPAAAPDPVEPGGERVDRGGRRAIPLTGADAFLRAFDAEIRRWNGASHVSQLVLRLGPGLDPEALRALLARVARAQPILTAPLRRRLGVLAPAYRLDRASGAPPPVAVHEAPGPPPPGELPEVFRARLNQPLRGRAGELLRADLLRYPDGASDLALSWLHMLFDGSGSEHFVRWLDACHRGAGRPEETPLRDELDRDPAPQTPLGPRGEGARAWQRWVRELGDPPPRSPAGPRRRVRQDLEVGLLAFDREQSARIAAAARERAGFLTPTLFYLAAALRAHHAVFRKRGADPQSYLVPLPVNLRPRGAAGALFRTHVSLLWFRVLPAQVEERGALVATLLAQRRQALRDGQIENGLCAMDFARHAPTRLYARMARRHLAGELCSFFFAYTGEFLAELPRFLGAPLRDGFHVAPVPPSPGSALAFSFRDGRLNATHVRQRGVFGADELAVFAEQLRCDLLEAGP